MVKEAKTLEHDLQKTGVSACTRNSDRRIEPGKALVVVEPAAQLFAGSGGRYNPGHIMVVLGHQLKPDQHFLLPQMGEVE